MGRLRYGPSGSALDVEDRTLAHIELVVVAKLRRKEGFVLSIDTPVGGRRSLWINPASSIEFEFETSPHDIDRSLLESYMDQANGARGLRLGDVSAS